MRDRLLHQLAHLIIAWPRAIVGLAILTAIIAGSYALLTLELHADTDELIGEDRPFMQPYRAFLDEFGDLEYIHILIDAHGDGAIAHTVVDDLVDRLQQLPDVPRAVGSVSAAEQLRIATRAMPIEQLVDLVDARHAIATLTARPSLDAILTSAQQHLDQLVALDESLTDADRRAHGASAVLLLQSVASTAPDSASRSHLKTLVETDIKPQYLTTDSGLLHVVSILPVKNYGTLGVISEPLARIRTVIDDVRAAHPGVEIGLTGKPVLQADEMSTTNADMRLAAIIAVLLVSVLFMVVVGGVVRPLLALVAFACAAGWTYGFAALFVGRLNLLSVVFMLILIGVGVDYGVHVLERYREFRRKHDIEDALVWVMRTAVRGNLTGALTSSVVFFAALLTSFQGLRELGLIAGAGLLLCLAAMTFVLPALLVLNERRQATSSTPEAAGIAPATDAHLEDGPHTATTGWHFAHAGKILLAGVAVTLFLTLGPNKLNFEQNLLELQASGLESVQWQQRLAADSASATWFGAVIVDDIADVQPVIDRAAQFTTIGAARSVLDAIAQPSNERAQLRAQLDAIATSPHQPVNDAGDRIAAQQIDHRAAANRLDMMSRTLVGLRSIARTANADQQVLLRELGEDLAALSRLLRSDAQWLEHISTRIGHVARSFDHILAGNSDSLREALPDAARNQMVASSGRYLVMLHPAGDVWQYEPMRAFVENMRAVDADVTGVPITHFESMGDMRASFGTMTLMAIFIVAVILLIDFRHFITLLLTLAPLALGIAWTIGAMGWLGVSFNLANFFAVPILIGLSIDASVHIMHRQLEGGPEQGSLGGTGRAVLLTALTTMVGFGALCTAHHRGLQSLGFAMIIGTAACLLTAAIILPAALSWFEHRHDARHPVHATDGDATTSPAPRERRKSAA